MKPGISRLCLSSIVLYCLTIYCPCQAQVTQDATLPNNSVVTPVGAGAFIIRGGTLRGNNLFHSFEQFSIPTNGLATFQNALTVQNIIGRVTGASISTIDGTLRTNGAANLFLMNPNGIIFGPNASLNLGGSFVATTANAIGFGDRGFFGASPANAPSSLLTVNPSAFLFNQIATHPKPITVEGTFLQISDSANPQNLLLVGGNINLTNQTYVAAPSGRIELAGLSEAGIVNLNNDGSVFRLSLPDGVQRADIVLSDSSTISTSGERGGAIQIQGRHVRLTDGSLIISNTKGAKPGEPLTINASNSLELFGSLTENKLTGLITQTEGSGAAGDLGINTGRLTIRDGAQASTSTYARNRGGRGGNLTVYAADSIELSGTALDGQVKSGLFSEVEPRASGNAGNLTISTPGILIVRDQAQVADRTFGSGNAGNLVIAAKSVIIQGGAQLSASTFAQGNAGNLTVDAPDFVEVVGRIPDGSGGSGLFSQANPGAIGDAGNLTITTGRFTVRDGAQVGVGALSNTRGKGGSLIVNADLVEVLGSGRTRTDRISSKIVTNAEGIGNAGQLQINTRRLVVRDSAQVSASTSSQGQGGNLTVNAADSIELSGFRISKIGLLVPSGLSVQGNPGATGAGGNLSVFTGRLLVENRAQIAVSNTGVGSGGNLAITARSIQLDQGSLVAATASGNGGNIGLQVKDLLLLRHDSQVSTSAGNAGSRGNGGNITINAPFIAAAPLENSDITANAFFGKGGSVTINAQGIFWLVPRSRTELERLLGTTDPTQLNPSRLPTNDITAISQTNPVLNGQVTINTPDVDPSRGLFALPANLVDALRLVAQGCAGVRGQQASRFTVMGRGGLPSNPGDSLGSEAVPLNWVTLDPNEQHAGSTTLMPGNAESGQIVEAQGVVRNAQGEVFLVAQAPTTAYSGWHSPTTCYAP